MPRGLVQCYLARLFPEQIPSLAVEKVPKVVVEADPQLTGRDSTRAA